MRLHALMPALNTARHHDSCNTFTFLIHVVPGNLAIVTEYLPRNSLYQVARCTHLQRASFSRHVVPGATRGQRPAADDVGRKKTDADGRCKRHGLSSLEFPAGAADELSTVANF